jgi:hypothetical protein
MRAQNLLRTRISHSGRYKTPSGGTSARWSPNGPLFRGSYQALCPTPCSRRMIHPEQPIATATAATPSSHDRVTADTPHGPSLKPPSEEPTWWSDMVALAPQLRYPQLPDSYIRVKDCTEGFMKYLVGVSDVLWADVAGHESPETEPALVAPPSEYSSLVVHPSTPLSQAAQLTITQILTSQVPDIPAPHLLAMFALGEEGQSATGRSPLCLQFKQLGLLDDALCSRWEANPMLQELEPLRCQTLQWLSTRHHFPIRAAVQPHDVAEVGPQVVWALVRLHHHVMGALRAWGEGRLTSRQLADIYDEAAR